MSPLITILILMLLTVVFNESQYLTDYQDAYQSALNDNSIPLQFCDSALQRKICESSVYGWRKFFKDNNALDYDDEDLHPNRESLIYDVYKKFGQKRNYVMKRDDSRNCETEKNLVQLDDGYFPNVLANISCAHTSGEFRYGNRICMLGTNCQPVIHNAIVLKRRERTDSGYDDIPGIPLELRACWKFEYIPIEVGCKCGRN